MRKMIPLFLLSSTCVALHAQPRLLTSFEQVMTSLKSGHAVRAVIHYARCTLIVDGEETKAPDALGGMELKTFEYFASGVVRNPKAYLAASETVLISHPRYGYVYNYVKMKCIEDGEVEIVARYLKPSTLEIVMDEVFKGRLSNGDDTNGIYLFEN